MMSDVPFGVFLSGGIDSSTNVALMAQLMDRPVDTFTVGLQRPHASQRARSARSIAQRIQDQPPRGADPASSDMIGLSRPAHPFPGRADRRLGVHPALFRLQARARQRHDGRAGRRRLGRAVLRATRATWGISSCTDKYWAAVPQLRAESRCSHGVAAGARTAAARETVSSPSMPTSSIARRVIASMFWSGAHVFWDVAQAPARRTTDACRPAQPSSAARRRRPAADPTYLVPDTFNVISSFLEAVRCRDHPGRTC